VAAVTTPTEGPGGTVKKSDREIMEILEAFDATGVAHSAAPLCKADPKTVRRSLCAARNQQSHAAAHQVPQYPLAAGLAGYAGPAALG
jgi:hypothetical protein